jgi:CubicO group peptidase (beta-lactamase class C family)
MRVLVATQYQAQTFTDAANIIQQYANTLAARLPIHPLSEADPAGQLALLFSDSTGNAYTSLGALLIDGKVYLHPPQTRHGPYPYPYEMRHGVFSVTKSMGGALSLFYLAQRYEEAIFDELITEYVPVLANHPAWQGVTFFHALNLVVGNEGEDVVGDNIYQVSRVSSLDEKLAEIAKLGDAPEAPGEQFQYNSINDFVLSVAMQQYVQEKEGPGINYWDLVRENVLKPIKADTLAILHTQESDGSQGIPIQGTGAVATLDEIAKIAILIENEGLHEGQQLLHGGKIREALRRTAWTGFLTDFQDQRYNHSFWSHDISTVNGDVTVSNMVGGGGSFVSFLPDKVMMIRLSDEGDFFDDPLIQAIEELRPGFPFKINAGHAEIGRAHV